MHIRVLSDSSTSWIYHVAWFFPQLENYTFSFHLKEFIIPQFDPWLEASVQPGKWYLCLMSPINSYNHYLRAK